MTPSSVVFTLVTIFLFQTLAKVQSSNSLIKSSCLNIRTNEEVEKCELCQGKTGCSSDGVQDRFFMCTDNVNYGFDCNLEQNTTVLQNFVTLHELRENRTCYFDLTNMKNGYEYRSRFYLNKSYACSNSTIFDIEKGYNKYTYKVTVSSKVIPDMVEGPQIFHFANNKTYESFYYDQNQRNKISRRLCKKSGYDNVTYTNIDMFEVSQLSNEFHDCVNYIEKYKGNNIDKYIKCKVVKNITCDQKTILHRDNNDVECNWKLNVTSTKFTITIHNKKNVYSHTHSVPKHSFGTTDLIGYLECKISDQYLIKDFTIEEPFVLRKEDGVAIFSPKIGPDVEKASSALNPLLITLICVCLGGVGISLFVYYRNKKVVGNILKPMNPLNEFALDVFPDVPDDQCVNYDTDESDMENDSHYDILPKWLTNRQDMIFSPECIEKKEMLGHGQYGTVTKGIFRHGNAVFNIAIKSNRYVAPNNLTQNGIDSCMGALMEEAKSMLEVGSYHENIVNLQGVTCMIENGIIHQFALLLEYCTKGNLRSYLIDNQVEFRSALSFYKMNKMIEKVHMEASGQNRDVTLFYLWLHQIASGMQFLSEKNIYHGDLAARNILLTDHLIAKISDFGLSKRLYQEIGPCAIQNEEDNRKLILPMKWLALEILNNGVIVPIKSDAWSYGVIMWEMFELGAEPYAKGITYTQLREELSKGMRLPKPDFCPDETAKIMHSCFHESPQQRPTFSEIAALIDQKFKQLVVQEKSVIESEGYLKGIQDTNVNHSERMKTEYVEMKSQNKMSRKEQFKLSTIEKLNSLEETKQGIQRKKNQTYVNACFEHTEPKNVQPRNEDDLKLNDQRLYFSMGHETPLLDVLSTCSTITPQKQRPIRYSGSASQENLDKATDKTVIKATQSCNPLYMVMDQLEHAPKESLDDHKRNTICYL